MLCHFRLFAAAAMVLATPVWAQTLPPGAGQEILARSCAQCHDLGLVTSQRKSAADWADTLQQMIGNGARVAPADFDKLVAYLGRNFGIAGTDTTVAGPAPRSRNEVPDYAPVTWRKVGGQPIETRWPEKQDDAPDLPGQTRAPYRASQPYVATTITDKLNRPWALQFLSDGRMLVTERMGAMVMVDAKGMITPLTGVPEVVWEGGQGGLLDVALDPGFARNHRIFFSYDEPAGPQKDVGKDGAQSRIVVGRATLDMAAAALKEVKVIFRSRPAVSVNLYPTKQGSRIAVDREGNLFVTIGDRDSTKLQPPAWNVAQDLSTHLGKIVRITPDGEAAPGNPFTAKPDALPEIWATGVRSQEGLAFDDKGRLWEVEDGPRGGDELNIITKGSNYGWPVVTHGVDYPGWVVNMGATHHSGMEDPRYYWDPTIAPSGLTFYHGKLFAAWQGNLFVGALRGQMLDRLVLSADDKVVAEEPLLTELHQRIRDVREGPDGALYVLTDTDSLIRIAPK